MRRAVSAALLSFCMAGATEAAPADRACAVLAKASAEQGAHHAAAARQGSAIDAAPAVAAITLAERIGCGGSAETAYLCGVAAMAEFEDALDRLMAAVKEGDAGADAQAARADKKKAVYRDLALHLARCAAPAPAD